MLLQHITYASSIYPAHRVRVRSGVEMQAGSRGTVLKGTGPYQTVPLRENEAKLRSMEQKKQVNKKSVEAGGGATARRFIKLRKCSRRLDFMLAHRTQPHYHCSVSTHLRSIITASMCQLKSRKVQHRNAVSVLKMFFCWEKKLSCGFEQKTKTLPGNERSIKPKR